MRNMIRTKKLYITIPEDLFLELREKNQLRNIDQTVIELLYQHLEE